MPTVFRGMLSAPDGMPELGTSGCSLGVRLDGPLRDISLTENGTVGPHAGGMSVAPSLAKLPMHRIPKRLRHRFAEARGSSSCAVYRFGDGGFVSERLAHKLQLRVTSASHGLVEPEGVMPLNEYLEALARTRDLWRIDET